jgi:hypothetical protein
MEAIGGYFELELRKGEHYHQDALRLNTARNCFEYILLARKYTKVYIPYYTCEVMLQPLHKLHIAYEFYHINESLEPVEIIQLGKSEAFLYTNYFGLKQRCVEYLASIYQSQLIVDNAQAFYAPRIAGIDTFYSPRKFFGVPDGGYLYTDVALEVEFFKDKSYNRMQHLLQRIDEGAESAYIKFRENDDALDNQPIKNMSALTERILESVDYEDIKRRRIENYLLIDKKIRNRNMFRFVLPENAVPMVYPYMTEMQNLKDTLILNRIFIATYWPNVFEWTRSGMLEYTLAKELVLIPIDQRLNARDFNYIENFI